MTAFGAAIRLAKLARSALSGVTRSARTGSVAREVRRAEDGASAPPADRASAASPRDDPDAKAPPSPESSSLGELTSAELGFVAVAWLLTVPAAASLRTLGFRRTAQLAARTPRLGLPAVEPGRAEDLTAAAFAWSPAPGSCLPRAVVQLVGHRLAGTPVRFVVGVRRGAPVGPLDGFAAHAWIEGGSAHRDAADHEVIFEVGGG